MRLFFYFLRCVFDDMNREAYREDGGFLPQAQEFLRKSCYNRAEREGIEIENWCL